MWSYLYPGQGSQHPGMGRFLFDNFKIARETFEESNDALQINIQKMCFDGSEADLALTENTQPALLTTSVVTSRVLKEMTGIKPLAAAGHSIGEYAACVSAGVMSFADAVKAVRVRGQAMQKAVPVGEGGMFAVMGMNPEQVQYVCRWSTEKSKLGAIEPANYNAPGQIVISGSLKTLNWLKENAQSPELAQGMPGENKRIKMIPLNVSAPFHCSLMKPAEEIMKHVLEGITFQDSQYPIIQNFTAEPVSAASVLRENLILQVSGAVRWTECVEKIATLQVTKCIEVGAGKVLSGLIKKINPELPVFNINSLDDLKLIEAQLN